MRKIKYATRMRRDQLLLHSFISLVRTMLIGSYEVVIVELLAVNHEKTYN